MDRFLWKKRPNQPPPLHPLDDPEQPQILRELQARAGQERAKFLAALERPPRPPLELQPGPGSVRLQLAPMGCWKCKHLIQAVRGYITHQTFVPLAQVSDTRTVAALVVELRRRDPKLSPLSHRYSKTIQGGYFAAECPNRPVRGFLHDCRILDREHHLRLSQLRMR